MQFLAAAFSLLIVAVSAFNLQPPANDWAKAGSTKELVCKSTVPITSCSWDTPYDKNYPLGPGLKAEAGRLEYVDNGNEKECGIRIKSVNATDDGVWACNVGVVDEGEVSSAKGQSRLNIAQKPKSVKLMDPYDADFVNITNQGSHDIKCVVEDAMPEPFFSWTIDQDLLENADTSTKQDGQTWIQTLSYTPTVEHHNRSLTCKTSHVGFEDGDETEASVVIVFNTNQDLLPAETSADDNGNLGSTIGIVFGIGIAILLFFGIPGFITYMRHERGCGAKPADQEGGQEKEDSQATVEAGTGEKDEEKVNLTAEESSNDVQDGKSDVVEDGKAVEEAVPAAKEPVQSLGNKIASFFRMRRDSSKVDDVETAVTTDDNSTENSNDEKKTDEEPEKKTEDATENVTEDKAVEAKKEAVNGGFSIWSFFKRSTAKKTEGETGEESEEKKELTAEEKSDKEKAAVEEEGEKKESDDKKEDKAEETEEKEPTEDNASGEKTEDTEKQEKEEEENESTEEQPKTPTPEEEPKTTSPRHTPV